MHLSAFEPTYDADAPEAAYRYLDEALARGAWAILVFHDVLPKRHSPGDTTCKVHERILARAARGDL